MNIEQRPLTSGSYWTDYRDRVAIVDHIMQGNIAGSEARFNNKAQQVSAHFGVGRDGRVVQWVSMNCSAWANGILEDGYDVTIPWLLECATKDINPNRRTISIEHEGDTGDSLTPAQYEATLELHIYIIQHWPTIKPSRKTIVPHRAISPKSKPFCPGTGFPFDKLIAELEGIFPMNGNKVPGNFPVRPEFATFWFENGGLPIFGYPISGEGQALGKYGKAGIVQYFERARFELQPDGSVMLGLVGAEAQGFRRASGTL
jgi:N-acetyl-anhydromuramyl-L-alanine amidase AmpD